MEQLQRCRATKQNKKQKKTFQLESKKGGEFVKRERRINERTPRQNGQAVFYSLKLQNVTSLKTDLFPFSFLHISLSLSFLGRFVSTCLPTYLPTYLGSVFFSLSVRPTDEAFVYLSVNLVSLCFRNGLLQDTSFLFQAHLFAIEKCGKKIGIASGDSNSRNLAPGMYKLLKQPLTLNISLLVDVIKSILKVSLYVCLGMLMFTPKRVVLFTYVGVSQ